MFSEKNLRRCFILLALLLIGGSFSMISEARADIVNGTFGPLEISVTKGVVEGGFSAKTSDRKHRCNFFFRGKRSGDKVSFISWHGSTPEKTLPGTLVSIPGGVILSVKGEHEGCSTAAPGLRSGLKLTMESPREAGELAVVASTRAYLFKKRSVGRKKKYLVENNVVRIIENPKGEHVKGIHWVRVAFHHRKYGDSTGWMMSSDLHSGTFDGFGTDLSSINTIPEFGPAFILGDGRSLKLFDPEKKISKTLLVFNAPIQALVQNEMGILGISVQGSTSSVHYLWTPGRVLRRVSALPRKKFEDEHTSKPILEALGTLRLLDGAFSVPVSVRRSSSNSHSMKYWSAPVEDEELLKDVVFYDTVALYSIDPSARRFTRGSSTWGDDRTGRSLVALPKDCSSEAGDTFELKDGVISLLDGKGVRRKIAVLEALNLVVYSESPSIYRNCGADTILLTEEDAGTSAWMETVLLLNMAGRVLGRFSKNGWGRGPEHYYEQVNYTPDGKFIVSPLAVTSPTGWEIMGMDGVSERFPSVPSEAIVYLQGRRGWGAR